MMQWPWDCVSGSQRRGHLDDHSGSFRRKWKGIELYRYKCIYIYTHIRKHSKLLVSFCYDVFLDLFKNMCARGSYSIDVHFLCHETLSSAREDLQLRPSCGMTPGRTWDPDFGPLK